VRSVRALLASSVAALLLAGCGGADSIAGSGSPATSPTPADNGVARLSADEILAKAKAALQGAEAVRIKGSAGRGTERTDIDMRYSGSNAQGKISVGGQQIELRRIGQTVYLKGSREFWTSAANAAAAELLTGKWLKTSLADPRFAPLAEFTDLSKAADGILDPEGTARKGGRKTIAGTPAIALVDSKEGGALYVATTGKPYPLRIEPKDAKDPKEDGTMTFTDFGKKVAVPAPPAELVVDVSKLGN
jgi:hypothetical protein